MAHAAAEGLRKVQGAVSGFVQDKKIADLAKDTTDVHAPVPFTTDHGTKVDNVDNWLKVSDDKHAGSSLLEDQIARERIHRFDHERIPERVVHARGTGAFGHFKLLESAEDVTTAGVLTDTSRTTPVFTRFSTVQGSKGSADTVRDVRGFATKFYTEEGIWDLVGNNIPVFFIQEAIKFPDIVHAVKPEPHNEIPQAQTAHNNFWDFVYMHPEATHIFFWAMSDRAIPRSYRMMQGFGVNTFALINKEGKRHFVKFHWMPELGVHSMVWDECLKVAGQDPDFHRKDLMEAIDNKAYPKWKLGIQVLPEEKQDDFEFDILDATKIWPEHLVPIRWIGELELNRNVDEFFTQTEQVAFCTSHVVPGIDFTDDPLLQGRNFSYFDTQISRLGINWEELPINRPVCPVMTHNRDGQMRHRITQGTVNYWPNRFEAAPPNKPDAGNFHTYPSKVSGFKQRGLPPKFREHINQAQLFWNSMSDVERFHMVKAFSFELDHCDDPIVYNRLVDRLTEIDLSLAQQVAVAVGAPTPTEQKRPNNGSKTINLAQLEINQSHEHVQCRPDITPTIKGRRVAIIIGDGYDQVAYLSVRTAVAAASAIPLIIGTKRQPIFADREDPNTSKGVIPDHMFDGQRSTMFDATFIPGGSHVRKLGEIGQIRHWIAESFGHCKAIGATGEAVNLVSEALGQTAARLDISDATGEGAIESYGVVTTGKLHEPHSLTQGVRIFKEAKDFLGKFFFQISQHRNFKREMDGLIDGVAY